MYGELEVCVTLPLDGVLGKSTARSEVDRNARVVEALSITKVPITCRPSL